MKTLPVLLAGLLFLSACAAPPVPKNRDAFVRERPVPKSALPPRPLPPPPVLSERQLLGLQPPPSLAFDPASGKGALPEVMDAFFRLREKARVDGWKLALVSGHRSFQDQTDLWNRYERSYYPTGKLTPRARVREIMRIVSIPGLSRHQWGTELDITENSLRGRMDEKGESLSGRVRTFREWMDLNAPNHGFCRIYRGGRGAVRDEPWHWSFTAYAGTYQSQFQTIKDFSRIFDERVTDGEYIRSHFEELYEKETGSVSDKCGQKQVDSRQSTVDS